eukprot:TRINITY_DN11111_c0_g1_i1.p1 TRINITY_DN11111_c0_g1~~TRINITY_DN11111_c0_g1_i1.p1  ORF type:complete len:557 (+),score=75.57 TRINITY_DN11111_c0_g1_i1:191-1861(+)
MSRAITPSPRSRQQIGATTGRAESTRRPATAARGSQLNGGTAAAKRDSQLDPNALLEKVKQLETYKKEEEKERKKAEAQRKKELADARKHMAKEVRFASRCVRKSESEATKLSRNIQLLEEKAQKVSNKRVQLMSQLELEVSKAQQTQRELHARWDEKLAEIGEAKSKLANAEMAAKLLELGVVLPSGADGQLALPDWTFTQYHVRNEQEALGSSQFPALLEDPRELAEENARLAAEVQELRGQLDRFDRQQDGRSSGARLNSPVRGRFSNAAQIRTVAGPSQAARPLSASGSFDAMRMTSASTEVQTIAESVNSSRRVVYPARPAGLSSTFSAAQSTPKNVYRETVANPTSWQTEPLTAGAEQAGFGRVYPHPVETTRSPIDPFGASEDVRKVHHHQLLGASLEGSIAGGSVQTMPAPTPGVAQFTNGHALNNGPVGTTVIRSQTPIGAVPPIRLQAASSSSIASIGVGSAIVLHTPRSNRSSSSLQAVAQTTPRVVYEPWMAKGRNPTYATVGSVQPLSARGEPTARLLRPTEMPQMSTVPVASWQAPAPGVFA